jgi:hypothetical protein
VFSATSTIRSTITVLTALIFAFDTIASRQRNHQTMFKQYTMFTQQTLSFQQAMAMFMNPSLVPVRFFGTTYLFSLDYFPPKMLISSSPNGIYISSDIILWIVITMLSVVIAIEVLRIVGWIAWQFFRCVWLISRQITLRMCIAVGLLGVLVIHWIDFSERQERDKWGRVPELTKRTLRYTVVA